MRWLTLVLVLGCSGLLPPSSVSMEGTQIDPRCAEANTRYQNYHAAGVVLTSVAAATTGGGVVSDFVTDEKWIGIGLDLVGIASGAVGLGMNLLADDAAEDVVRYCPREE